MIGLEWPRPGIAFFHKKFSHFSAFQAETVVSPLAIPVAFAPRNEGQFDCAAAEHASASKINKILEDCMEIRGGIQSIFLRAIETLLVGRLRIDHGERIGGELE